jgi:hypothetical protein
MVETSPVSIIDLCCDSDPPVRDIVQAILGTPPLNAVIFFMSVERLWMKNHEK